MTALKVVLTLQMKARSVKYVLLYCTKVHGSGKLRLHDRTIQHRTD